MRRGNKKTKVNKADQKVKAEYRRKKVIDIGPRPIEDWITTDKQKKLVEEFILITKQYCQVCRT